MKTYTSRIEDAINLNGDYFQIEHDNENGDEENEADENTNRGSDHDSMDDPNEYFDHFDEWVEDTSNFVPQNISDLGYLHSNTDCTVYDAFLMIYTYSIRHGLSWEATEDLARLVNRVIGEEKIPPSKYIFKQKFQRAESKPIKHFVCHKCELYLGTISDLKASKQQHCPNCSTVIETDPNIRKIILSQFLLKVNCKIFLSETVTN